MREDKITVEPFQFINYLSIECTKELNNHGKIVLSGIIDQVYENEYLEASADEIWVKIKAIADDNKEKILFYGILTALRIKKENQVSVLTIEVMTGSFLLDIKKHNRSFQDFNFRYCDVIKACCEPSDGKFIMLEKKDALINNMIMQYEETDWEFLKRLSSYMETALIAEDQTPGKKIYVGYRVMDSIEEIVTDSFQISQELNVYEKENITRLSKIHLNHFLQYIICSREIYGLGETVSFNGNNLVVQKIVSILEGQELISQYWLGSKEFGISSPIYNSKISGVSLMASVSAVEGTKVKVMIREDENKNNCKECWFDYATVYSTPDGTGWYCMPEIGDVVRVVFPDAKESHAYVASCVHVEAGSERVNPEIKSWKNKQNKEILFSPNALILRNNEGNLIELSDDSGIKIESDKDIVIKSKGELQIDSQSVDLYAKDYIRMKQGAASIQINENINISGGKIYMN